MNAFKLSIAVSAILLSGSALAGTHATDLRINLGSNSYDSHFDPAIPTYDANTVTGNFDDFSFNALLATSVYDINETGENGTYADRFGAFYDTNRATELNALGIATSGTAMDGSTNVDLVHPLPGQIDIDALSPLVPPVIGVDSEGYLLSWDLKIMYHFDGILTASGPVYTGGTFELEFDDKFDDSNDRTVLSGVLTGSTLTGVSLLLDLEIDYAEAGFLLIDDGTGTFVDANATTSVGDTVKFDLHTEVTPPIPTAAQLLVVNGVAIRQSELNGGIHTNNVPEPSSLALLGLGLLGFRLANGRKNG